VRSVHFPLVMATAALLAVGLVLADDYGPSWDESNTVPYAEESLSAILTLSAPETAPGNLRYYGPAYLVLTEAITKIGRVVMPRWQEIDLRHLTYFLCLPIAMVSLYVLARRWVSPGSALLVSVLFATQPLFFGHAYINPKDIPFLSFFLLSVALGSRMAERVDPRGMWIAKEQENVRGFLRGLLVSASQQFHLASRRKKLMLIVLFLIAVALATELLFLQVLVLPAWLALVRQAYNQESLGLINRAFSAIAEQSTNLQVTAYTAKAARLYLMASRPIALISFLPAVLVLGSVLRPTIRSLEPARLIRDIILAGIAMGLTTSIRVAGPFAGFLVTGLVIARARRGSVGPLVVYWTTAAIVTYLTWPYLWGSPWERYMESFRVMREFDFEFPVLFRGSLYPADELPGYFVPSLFAVQLTEPVLPLALAGAVLALRRADHSPRWNPSKLFTALWLILPLSLASFSSAARYDNGRQFLFILPPLFLFAGLSVEELRRRLGTELGRAILAAAILAPGIFAISRLHPFEYVYYNSLVGGVRGANRAFELDYWATSYREGISVLNEIAPVGSSVFVFGSSEALAGLMRQDLTIYNPPHDTFDRGKTDYLLVTTRAKLDLAYRGWADVVARIEADGAELAYVLRSPAGD